MTNNYAFKIRFRWWTFRRPAILWASCSSEAVARASQQWIGVKSAEGFNRKDYK